MKLRQRQPYLNGKSLFIISLTVVAITVVTVYLSGINYRRSITDNFYISLSIIGVALFLFMLVGLYKGLGLNNNFPEYKNYKMGDFFSLAGTEIDTPAITTDDPITSFLGTVLSWILVTIVAFVLLIVLEVLFWASLFTVIALLYWVFFRALRLVFIKSRFTKGKLKLSTWFAIQYTLLFVGWMFVLVYLVDLFKT